MKPIEKYINEAIKGGFSKEVIREKVIAKGYDEKVIDAILEEPIKKPKKEFKLFKPKEPKVIKIPEVMPVVEKETIHPDIIDNNQPLGLKSQLKEVNEQLSILTKRNKKKEFKEFGLPSKFKRQLKKLALKNKLLVILLTRNRGMIPMVTEIKDGFVNIGGTPHQCAVDQVFLWKGKYPAMVIPEWDIRPIGTKDYYDAVQNKTIADPIAIAIRMMENREAIMKNKLSPKIWIFVGLAIIAGLYVLFGGA